MSAISTYPPISSADAPPATGRAPTAGARDLLASASVGSTWRSDLTLVGLLALVFVVYFTGNVSSDDLGYLYCARFGPEIASQLCPNYVLRFLCWTPLALMIRLFPNHGVALGVAPLITAAGLLLVVARFARRLGIQRPWIPLAILGLSPLVVMTATVTLPDLTAAAWAWLGLMLCAPCLLERDAGRRTTLRCVAGGLFMAMSYNSKETAAILIPCLGLFVLLYRLRSLWAWQRMLLIGAGAAAWVGAETLLLWIVTSDPLYHSHTLAQCERGYGGPPVPTTLREWWLSASEYLRWLVDPRSDYGPSGPLMLGGLAMALLRSREARYGLLACLVLPALAYLSLGSSSLLAYEPLVRQTRHLLPFLPALALAAGLAIERFWPVRRAWQTPARIASVVAMLVLLYAPNRIVGHWYYAATYAAGERVIAEHAAAHPGATLYASGLSLNRFLVPTAWVGGTLPTAIPQPPQTRAEWLARYDGAYVFTTRIDRIKPRKRSQDERTLYGPSADALRTFTLVERREPPRDRLSQIVAYLLRRPCPTDPTEAVEVYHVHR